MNVNLIGEQILKFRRAMGMTQEELGKAVGVSAQAVSRWECGGTPDVTLMPAIADTLHVSIGALFGREESAMPDMTGTLERWICSYPEDEAIHRLSRMLWEATLRAIPKVRVPVVYPEHGEQESQFYEDERVMMHTILATDGGMVLSVGAQDFSFLITLPEPEKGYEQYFLSNDAYREIFSALAMPGSLELLRYFGRVQPNYHIASVAAKRVGLPAEVAHRALDALEKVGLLSKIELSLEEGPAVAYAFMDPTGLVPLLYFARWVGQKEKANLVDWTMRERPFLKAKKEDDPAQP